MGTQHEKQKNAVRLLQWMVWGSAAATAVTLLLRIWLTPTLRDSDTGRFENGWPIVALLVAAVVALLLGGRQIPPVRRELTGGRAVAVSLAALLTGGCLGIVTLWEGWLWLAEGILPPPDNAPGGALGDIAVALTFLFGLLGGITFIRLGLLLTAEGATRRGMLAWGALAPVLWMWFRLVRYEVSYASALGLAETFYDFGLFMVELVFLFLFARYISGVGTVSVGTLLAFSCATAVFGISGPLTRLAMYLIGDSDAYEAAGLAGVTDFAVGVLALVLAFALLRQYAAEAPRPVPGQEEDSSPEVSPADGSEDAPVEEVSPAEVPAEQASAEQTPDTAL